MSREKRIEELCKDLSDAPTGGVNEDFTVGTLKESHTSLFIRTVAGHLVSLNYHKQKEAEWLVYRERTPFGKVYCVCSRCGRIEYKKEPYCNCGAKMKGCD